MTICTQVRNLMTCVGAMALCFALCTEQTQGQGVPVSAKLELQSGIQAGANGKNHIPINRDDPAANRLDSSPAIYVEVTFADGNTAGPHDYHQNFANNVVFDDTSGDPNDLIQVSYWDVDHEKPDLGKFAAQLQSTGNGVGTATLKISFRNAPGVTASVPVSVVSDAVTAKPTLHVISVVDTTEESRKKDREHDLQTTLDLMKNVEESLEGELTLNQIVIRDKNWKGSDVINACKGLDVKPNDAVYFFYNGHGFRTAEMSEVGNIFPALGLEKNSDGSRNDVKLTDVFKALMDKQPRLLLVIGDTCNVMAPSEWTPPTRGTFRKQMCKELFVNSKGGYLASGSQPGTPTYTNRKTGSFFTNKFVGSISEVLTSNAYDETTSGWNSIFTKSCQELVVYRPANGDPMTQTGQFKSIPLQK